MPHADESLLKSFAIHRDEKAFRTLAERYLGLIFHTALRRTGNRQLAEEISQNILCALAQKASSLAKNSDLLPAWLHRATLFESSKAMRSESSHQRRKQLLHCQESAEAPSPWRDAIPHLDLALDQLPESDRRVLLLHFFENRSFPKIARTLGKNPAAVQKQSRRALEKLARILRGKGVVLTATALATGLTSELAKAAPAAFLQSATTAVLTGSATYSTTALTLMTAAKSKALVPLVVLLCLTPLAIQQVAISAARSRIGQLQTRHAPEAAVEPSPSIDPIKSDPNNLAAWKELVRRFTLRPEGGITDTRIVLELRGRLAAMSADQIFEKMVQIPTWDLSYGDGWEMTLLRAVIEKDPQKALRHFEGQLASAKGNKQMLLVQAFGKWMGIDAFAATAWLDAQTASGNMESHRFVIRINETCRNQMEAQLLSLVIAEQLKTGADPAIQRFLALATDQQSFILKYGLTHQLHPEAAAGFVNFMRGVLPEDEYLDYLAKEPELHIEMAYNVAEGGDLEKVSRFLDSINAIPEERRVFAERAAESGLYRLMGGENGTVDRAAVDTLRKWLAREVPEHVDWITGNALGRIRSPFQVTAPLVESIYQETGGDDVLVAYLSLCSGEKYGSALESLAAEIKDDAKRAEIMAKLRTDHPNPGK
jgi:RNA polymerase sigma factor (sigma-70 family)